MPTPCRLCPGRTFQHAQALEQHKAAVHCFPCEQCSTTRIFRTLEALEQHNHAAHPDNHCRRCNRIFRTPSRLGQHLLDAHPQPACMHHQAVMDQHLVVMHPSYPCYSCAGRTFRDEDEEHDVDVHSHQHSSPTHQHCKRCQGGGSYDFIHSPTSMSVASIHSPHSVHSPSMGMYFPAIPAPMPTLHHHASYPYDMPTSGSSRTMPGRGNAASGSGSGVVPPSHSRRTSYESVHEVVQDEDEEEVVVVGESPYIFSPRPTTLPMTASFIASPSQPTPPPTTSPHTHILLPLSPRTTRVPTPSHGASLSREDLEGGSSDGETAFERIDARLATVTVVPLPPMVEDQSNRADEPSHSVSPPSVYSRTPESTPEVCVLPLGADLRLEAEVGPEGSPLPPEGNGGPALLRRRQAQHPASMHAPSPQRTDGVTNVLRLQELAAEEHDDSGETFVDEESEEVIVMIKRPSTTRSGSWDVSERMDRIKEARYRERERLEVEEEGIRDRELSKEQREAIVKGLSVLADAQDRARKTRAELEDDSDDSEGGFAFLPERRSSDGPSSGETFVLPSGEIMSDFRPRSWDLWKPSSNFVPTPIVPVHSLEVFESCVDFGLLRGPTPPVATIEDVKTPSSSPQPVTVTPKAKPKPEPVSWMTWQPDPAIVAPTPALKKHFSPIRRNPDGELKARVTSWASWKAPPSPPVPVAIVLPNPKSPGLFGPRSPILPSPKPLVSDKVTLPTLTTTFNTGGPRSPRTSPHSSSFDAPSTVSNERTSWVDGPLVDSPQPVAPQRGYPVSRVISPSSSICLQSPVDSWNDLEEKVSAYLSENGSGSGSINIEAQAVIVEPPTPPPVPTTSLSIQCRICKKPQCEDVTATMCGHIFCNTCITQAVVATSKCPVCDTATLLYCLFRLDLTTR